MLLCIFVVCEFVVLYVCLCVCLFVCLLFLWGGVGSGCVCFIKRNARIQCNSLSAFGLKSILIRDSLFRCLLFVVFLSFFFFFFKSFF